MKKKDYFLVLFLVSISISLLAVGFTGLHKTQRDAERMLPADDKEFQERILELVSQYFEENKADTYLLVSTSEASSLPVPLNEEYSFAVYQPDGSENVVRVGVNLFCMESSNCDNQNCVKEGIVTASTIKQRLLLNMVICLPHKLTLEMLSPEDAQTYLKAALSIQMNSGDSDSFLELDRQA